MIDYKKYLKYTKPITRRISNLLELFTCFFDIFASEKKAIQPEKVLLIVKPDAIGDYILFRNFLSIIRNSNKFIDYNIVILGNKIWKSLAFEYDNDSFDEFVEVDLKKLQRSINYRLTMINTLRKLKVEVIFQPVYSRQYYVDKIIKAIPAKTKIGVDGDIKNILGLQKILSDRFFNHLIKIENDVIFEFLKNKKSVEYLLDNSVDIQKPTLKVTDTIKTSKNKYAVLFPDASVNYKRWKPENFAKIVEELSVNYGLDIVLTGQNDLIAKKIISNTEITNIHDYTNQTTLSDLASIIKNAEILIANDTVAVHIGAATNTKTICIFNGLLYGRFIPYPTKVFENIMVIVPPEIENKYYNFLVEKYKLASNLNINDITVAQLNKQIRILLHK